MISYLTLLFLFTLVFASPLERRGNTVCGKFDAIQAGRYTLSTDLWGEAAASSGAQCVTLISADSDTVKWSTKWAWTGGPDSVKSFANVQLDVGINQTLSSITSMPSKWHWSMRNAGTEELVADVAYDFFTASSPGGAIEHEVMIWFGCDGAGPISFAYNQNGSIPIETNIPIADKMWNLHHGNNGYNDVLSLLPMDGAVTSFNGDLYPFFQHLIDQGHIDASETLVIAQAGTEAISGSAIFTTSAYRLAIH